MKHIQPETAEIETGCRRQTAVHFQQEKHTAVYRMKTGRFVTSENIVALDTDVAVTVDISP